MLHGCNDDIQREQCNFWRQRSSQGAEIIIIIIIIIFVYCRLTHATEQKILPQQAEISGIIVA